MLRRAWLVLSCALWLYALWRTAQLLEPRLALHWEMARGCEQYGGREELVAEACLERLAHHPLWHLGHDVSTLPVVRAQLAALYAWPLRVLALQCLLWLWRLWRYRSQERWRARDAAKLKKHESLAAAEDAARRKKLCEVLREQPE
jgi:hypothetical protein